MKLDLIITNRRSKRVCDAYDNNLERSYDAIGRPSSKPFQPFTEAELSAFVGILIVVGAH